MSSQPRSHSINYVSSDYEVRFAYTTVVQIKYNLTKEINKHYNTFDVIIKKKNKNLENI